MCARRQQWENDVENRVLEKTMYLETGIINENQKRFFSRKVKKKKE